jgi:hypothetical protein
MQLIDNPSIIREDLNLFSCPCGHRPEISGIAAQRLLVEQERKEAGGNGTEEME